MNQPTKVEEITVASSVSRWLSWLLIAICFSVQAANLFMSIMRSFLKIIIVQYYFDSIQLWLCIQRVKGIFKKKKKTVCIIDIVCLPVFNLDLLIFRHTQDN